MRSKIDEMAPKALNILQESSTYITTFELSKKLHLCKASTYKLIRKLRQEMNVGIISNTRGHILADRATKTDDLNFFRRILGRRTSDYIALTTAQNEIRRRWRSLEDKKHFNFAIKTLSFSEPSFSVITSGMNAFLKYSNKQKPLLQNKET